ncbi:MAG: cell division protein SepF [Clostridia bacterium]|nr:cell division protein SepF [Clostridia bacterium]
MSIGNKIKNLFSVSEEEYYDDMDLEENEREADDYSRDVRSNSFGFAHSRNDSDSKVVDMRASSPANAQAAAKAKIVFNKLDRYEDVGSVADDINDKRIVVLNLETCPNDVSVRIIDFLSGVAYANSGEMKRIAGRVYIITPYNVPLTGEMLDGIEHAY